MLRFVLRGGFDAVELSIKENAQADAELVHERVDKSLKLLCDSPDMGVQAPTTEVRTCAVRKTAKIQLELAQLLPVPVDVLAQWLANQVSCPGNCRGAGPKSKAKRLTDL